MAAHERSRAAAAPRLRGPGLGALQRAARTISPAVRGSQHASHRADDAGTDLPRAATSDAPRLPQAARGDVAEGPAASPAGRLVAAGADRRRLSADARRSDAALDAAPPRDLHGQDLLWAEYRAARREARRHRARPHRAALSVPDGRGPCAAREVCVDVRGVLGAG